MPLSTHSTPRQYEFAESSGTPRRRPLRPLERPLPSVVAGQGGVDVDAAVPVQRERRRWHVVGRVTVHVLDLPVVRPMLIPSVRRIRRRGRCPSRVMKDQRDRAAAAAAHDERYHSRFHPSMKCSRMPGHASRAPSSGRQRTLMSSPPAPNLAASAHPGLSCLSSSRPMLPYRDRPARHRGPGDSTRLPRWKSVMLPDVRQSEVRP